MIGVFLSILGWGQLWLMVIAHHHKRRAKEEKRKREGKGGEDEAQAKNPL